MGGANFILGAAVGAMVTASIYSDSARDVIKSAIGAIGNEIGKQLPFGAEHTSVRKEQGNDQ